MTDLVEELRFYAAKQKWPKELEIIPDLLARAAKALSAPARPSPAQEANMQSEKIIAAADVEAKALADRAGIDIGDDHDMFVDDLAQTITRFAVTSTLPSSPKTMLRNDGFAAGFEDYQAGADENANPYEEGSAQWRDWNEGWESAHDEEPEAALSTDAEPVALQPVDAKDFQEAVQLLPSVMRPALSKAIIASMTAPPQTAPSVAVKAPTRTELANAINAKIVEVNERVYGKNRAGWRMLTTGEIVDAVSALSAQVQDVAGWQDISTAPRDGTKILMRGGVYHGFPFPGSWDPSPYAPDRPWATVIGRSSLYEHVPTHWMPIPAAPASNQGESE